MPRNRPTLALLILVTTALGVGSRRFGAVLPAWVAAYAGDVLWALLVFWLVDFGWPRWPAGRGAAVALALAVAVEISQIYQAPWLSAVRHTALGGLVLGHGFLWSDVLCYGAGVALGYGFEWAHCYLANPRGAGRVGKGIPDQ